MFTTTNASLTLSRKTFLHFLSGSFSCEVSNSFAKETLNISLGVVSAISATLSASTQLVERGSDVSFTCSRSADYTDDWTAQLSCSNSYNGGYISGSHVTLDIGTGALWVGDAH